MPRFSQVDVFTDTFTLGNPVAVVHDADGVPDHAMAAFARWTNLSETTYLLAPTDPRADYRLRIFTGSGELPFAGHPTLGSARAWLAAGGTPAGPEIVQECGAGLVRIRRDGDRFAFAAPPLVRGGPVDDAEVADLVSALGVRADRVVGAQWCVNGPHWVALLLTDAAAVLAVEPDAGALGPSREVGIVGPHPPGGDADLEVRAFVTGPGPGAVLTEDPVTGSLNAAIAQWLIPAGLAPPSYVAAQGTRRDRRGRVHVERDGADVWVGGGTVVGVTGTVAL